MSISKEFLFGEKDLDDEPSNPTACENDSTLSNIVSRRYSRRTFAKGALASAVATNLGFITACSDFTNKEAKSAFNFQEITHGVDENHHVASGHTANVLVRWGDALFPNSPVFDPYNQTPDAQEKQFGYNNDFLGYISLKPNEGQEKRALLCVNHEYCRAALMFPNLPSKFWEGLTADMIEIEKAAVGNSIVEIAKVSGEWQVIVDSQYNRRISARSTKMHLGGPAAGHDRLKTNADPTGLEAIGTLNNCAGGITPWGTYLTCEENFNYHFDGKLPDNHRETENYRRYGVPGSLFKWGEFDTRFNVKSEPNEANRFGWVVEIDPTDPTSTPKKRTALGRLKHEGAKNVIAPDGRLVVYMGDDQRFDYLYKFVSRNAVDLDNKEANKDLLDEGTLYVAKFEEGGSLRWLSLTHGSGPLLEENGFSSQADVVIEARRAADLLEATPMDRPEDVVPNPNTGRVYVMLTNNTKRTEANIANPRTPNTFGHIIEITEPEANFASEHATWEILIQAGNPENPEHNASWNPATGENGWFASPDNGVIDPLGRLWVSTDQSEKSLISGTGDGLWSLDTEGEARGTGKMFFRCPIGAELCGPVFSTSGESLFLSVQHPGVNDKSPEDTKFETPTTRWPDFREDYPPRPSVVVVQKKSGGIIG